MSECICNTCKNLKGIVNEEGNVEEYHCEFGFPSDSCADCQVEECDVQCDWYVCDDEQENVVVVKCQGCGKELKQVCSDTQEGDVYCLDCFMKKG